jgi:cell division protein FtsW
MSQTLSSIYIPACVDEGRRLPDYVLLAAVILLLGFGSLMVFSTTALTSLDLGISAAFFFKRHIFSILIGGVLAFVCFNVKPHLWRKAAFPLLISSVLMLLLVLVIGKSAGGATRWVQIGSLRIQPAECVKLAIVVSIAAYADRFQHRLGSFLYGIVYPFSFLSGIAILLLLQPDFGSTAVIFFVTATQMLLVIRFSHFLSVLLAGIASGATLVALSPYRMRRFLAFQDPFSDPASSGYQLIQSLIAVGSGGLFGEGLGVGRQKLFYLPAAHTDFIFAVIAEEFGLIGAILVLFLFLTILFRGIATAIRLSDNIFLSLLAVGLTCFIVLPSLLNMGVVLGLLPTKGLVLPFISYGGTAMIMSCIAAGILLRLSSEEVT